MDLGGLGLGFVVIAVAEVVIPVGPVVGAVIAEEEVPEAFGVGVLRGDAAEIFHLAGGDGLALVIFCGEVHGNVSRAGRGRGHGLSDLEGVAAEFLDAQGKLEAGAGEEGFLFLPLVFEPRGFGEFLGVFEADQVGAGFSGRQGVGEIEGAVFRDCDRAGVNFLFGGIDDDDAGRAGFRGLDGVDALGADDALHADGFAGAVKRAVGEEERLARCFGGFVPRIADREMPEADGVERGVKRG